MSLSTQYSAGAFVSRIAVKKTQSIVEIRFSGQQYGEVIAAYPQVSLTSCEAASGRANYGGRLVCTLVYADDEGKLCRVQKGAEFTHFCDDDALAPAHTVQCALSVERTQVKRDGSSFLVAVVIGAELSVYARSERNVLSSLEGAIARCESQKLYSAVPFSGEGEVEDDFDCNAEDVLVPSAKVLVTDCNCRAGAVEICGEMLLSLVALRDNKPVCLDRVIPFKCEIPCETALLSKKAACHAEVKDLTVDARVNEEKGKCTVSVTASLAFQGCYYEEEETELMLDAFSSACKLNLTFCEEHALPCSDIKVYTEHIGGLCATKARLDYSCAFLAVALPKVEFARTAYGIEGSITATLIYEQNGETHSTEINLPFAVNLNGLEGDAAYITAAACGINIRQRAEGECEAEATLKVTAAECQSVTTCYVTDASEGEKLEVCNSAVSVYVPQRGDNLWDTAKKLGQSPAQIEATNPDLSFPLTGNERILVYRPKVN